MVFDVVCIGHLAKDRIVRGSEEYEAPGGACYYGSFVLRALGLRVAVVTRLAREDLPLFEELDSIGVSLFPVQVPETSGIENIHPDPDSDRRICRPRGFAGGFRAEDLPPGIEARLFYLGPIMPGEVPLDFLRHVASLGPVALDVQGILRRLRDGELVIAPREDQGEYLKLATYLKADDVEAKALSGVSSLEDAAPLIAAQGPREVVLTHREGVLVLADGESHRFPFRPRSLAGRTGRGDTCFSAYLGRRLLGDPPREAARFAAALTTLKLERPGPFRGSLEEVTRLLASP